jgi:catechol 2,3-dioxygenase-like lactoylglutathione lyase family enzyme
MILGLAHVCFRVADMDRALKFYTETLGFKRAFDFINDKGVRHGVYIKAGSRNFIELFQTDAVTPPADKQSFRHICLEVDDVAKTVVELRGKGVEVSEPKLGLDQSWQAWIKDPDGNAIELHGYTPKSWQVPHLG